MSAISAVWWVSNQPFVASVVISDLEFEVANEPVRVDLDIRPCKETNVIDISSDGIVRVAVLGSKAFDVDESTLVFGPSSLARVLEGSIYFKDVDRDGFVDLVSNHRIQQTGIAFGDVEACLAGRLFEGTPFEGCDDVLVIRQSSKER